MTDNNPRPSNEKKRIAFELALVYVLLMILISVSSRIVAFGTATASKMMLSVAVYVLFVAVPILAMRFGKISLSELGFTRYHIGKQLLNALLIFIATILLVLLPLLFGADKTNVLSFKSSSLEVLIFYLLYDLFCVGFGEELVFRGYFYARISAFTRIAWMPAVFSAVLFGMIHFPNTHNLINVAATAGLGFIYGLCRWKLKDCSLLSLSLAHGLHDAVIILLSYLIL